MRLQETPVTNLKQKLSILPQNESIPLPPRKKTCHGTTHVAHQKSYEAVNEKKQARDVAELLKTRKQHMARMLQLLVTD